MKIIRGVKIVLLLAFLALAGCASPGDFPGDHGCQIDPQSCR